MTITIHLDADETRIFDQGAIFDAARDAFPGASSICVESEDGASDTIYTKKENS